MPRKVRVLFFLTMASTAFATDQVLIEQTTAGTTHHPHPRLHAYQYNGAFNYAPVCTTGNINFSGAYRLFRDDYHIPQVPIMHRYDPVSDENFGAFFAPYTVKFTQKILDHLPTEVCQAATKIGANLESFSNVDIFMAVQGFPGSSVGEPFLFRPQYWALPEANTTTNGQRYDESFSADVLLLPQTMRRMTLNGALPGQIIYTDNYSLHDDAAGTPVIASSNEPAFGGLEPNKSFWSITKIKHFKDGRPAGRIAITLHSLLTPEAHDNLAILKQGKTIVTVDDLLYHLRLITNDPELLINQGAIFPTQIATLRFNRTTPHRDILVDGFSAPESHHTWTDGPVARMRIPAAGTDDRDVVLNFDIMGYIPQGDRKQPIRAYMKQGDEEIYVGSMYLDNLTVPGTSNRKRTSLTLHKNLFVGSPNIELRLDIGKPTRAPGGNRELGMALFDVTVETKRSMPNIVSGQIYETTAGGNGALYLVDGWSGSESTHTWSERYSAGLVLPGLTPGRATTLTLSGIGFNNDGSGRQTVTMFANGTQIAVFTTPNIPQIVIPSEVISSPTLRIDFAFWDPQQPHGGDKRTLAFALKSFIVQQ